MKRYNNLFDKIVSLDNLYLADKKANSTSCCNEYNGTYMGIYLY